MVVMVLFDGTVAVAPVRRTPDLAFKSNIEALYTGGSSRMLNRPQGSQKCGGSGMGVEDGRKRDFTRGGDRAGRYTCMRHVRAEV